MERKTLGSELATLGVIFDKVVTKEVLSAYYEILKDISDEQMVTASGKWQRQGKFFPKPSELLDMVLPPAGDAWALVLRQCRDWKGARLPPSIARAVNEIGGIRALAMSTEKDLGFKFHEFKLAYSPDRIDEAKLISKKHSHSRLKQISVN